ncbi:MAG: hypothetical protein H7836_08985 [Magnetococcus sp. YQC-3]
MAGDAARQVPVSRDEKRAAFAACRGVCAGWRVGGVVVAVCGGVAQVVAWLEVVGTSGSVKMLAGVVAFLWEGMSAGN